ncbi:hypothetical protein QCA50_012159 [Cerrena zonata]|uniref:Dynamin GTPase effector domain-containing protein n=1 Tax=Cerrena zonata TaxID=2478898 RepID=A0AAW0G2G2_9APHY
MAIVEEKFHPKPQVAVDPKTGKPLPPSQQPVQQQSPKDDNSNGFFGGFFSSKNKKRLQSMEAPPPVLRATGDLVKENELTVQKRKECLKMVEVLRNASEIVSSV